MHEVMKTFLHGKAANSRDNCIAGKFEFFEVTVGRIVELIAVGVIVFVKRVIYDIDFVKWNVIFFMDDALGGFGDGDDFVGKEKALLLDFVNQWIASMHAGAVVFRSVNVSNKRQAVLLLGEHTSFVSEPIVGMDEIGFKLHEVFFNEITVRMLDVANGDELGLIGRGDDFFEDLH